MKNTLFHISWGDGDNSYVVAPDEETARERVKEYRGLINTIVRLDYTYKIIFEEGRDSVDR